MFIVSFKEIVPVLMNSCALCLGAFVWIILCYSQLEGSFSYMPNFSRFHTLLRCSWFILVEVVFVFIVPGILFSKT